MSEQYVINHAIVPAAGYGTRLLPGTKVIPKEMFPIFNKPAIEYIADEIYDSDLNNMVLITSKNKESIVDHFDQNFELETILERRHKDQMLESITKFQDLNVINLRQKEQLGLGHAISIAQPVLNNQSFAVVLPDMLVKNGSKHLKMMLNIYRKTGKAVIALMEVPKNKVSSYGIVQGQVYYSNDFDKDLFHINNMVEKPKSSEAPSNLAILGRYILPYKIFNIIEQLTIEHQQQKSNKEIGLTDALLVLAKDEGIIGLIVDDEVHDIGSPQGFIKANILYGINDIEIQKYLINIVKSI